MNTWQRRARKEKAELDAKIQKIATFIASKGFARLSPDRRWLLVLQEMHMRNYSVVLGYRIQLPL